MEKNTIPFFVSKQTKRKTQIYSRKIVIFKPTF